jgi:ribosomal protein S18 acetylase RimI-like enzyme
LQAGDRPLLAGLLDSLSAFTAEERLVALELVDARLDHPESDDYRFILAFAGEAGDGAGLSGYLCYGRTPMTQSTYDLYWIATSPDFARSGVARGLVASMEVEIAREGGGTIRVETGSREGHGAAVHFYDAVSFARTATIPDFYAPGDDLIIFTKRVGRASAPPLAAMDEVALYDAAFGYRDYVADRDFLFACARRFGSREVRRVLCWAPGPARHLWAFADSGVEAFGAEPSDAMLAYARGLARKRAGTSSEVLFVKAGLDERPVGLGAPMDLSFVPLSAIHLLPGPAAIEAHLRLAAELLQVGGLHIIEATHPADLTPSGVHHTEWTEVRGDSVIDARFRMHLDKTTAEQGGQSVPVTLDVVCSQSARKGSSTPRPQQRLRQEDRWFIPDLASFQQIIARVPGLEIAAALGDFNVAVPFEHTSAWRLILVLKRVVVA